MKIVSLDKLINDDDDFREKDVFADMNVNIEDEIERKDEVERLKNALLQLNNDEYKLIKALFYNNSSLREYARVIGKSYGTVLYREKQILKKLKKMLKI